MPLLNTNKDTRSPCCVYVTTGDFNEFMLNHKCHLFYPKIMNKKKIIKNKYLTAVKLYYSYGCVIRFLSVLITSPPPRTFFSNNFSLKTVYC